MEEDPILMTKSVCGGNLRENNKKKFCDVAAHVSFGFMVLQFPFQFPRSSKKRSVFESFASVGITTDSFPLLFYSIFVRKANLFLELCCDAIMTG